MSKTIVEPGPTGVRAEESRRYEFAGRTWSHRTCVPPTDGVQTNRSREPTDNRLARVKRHV